MSGSFKMIDLCQACGRPTRDPVTVGNTTLCLPCDAEIKGICGSLEGKPATAAYAARQLYRESEDSRTEFILRNIHGGLWQAVRHRAVDDGDTIRKLLLKALFLYLEGE